MSSLARRRMTTQHHNIGTLLLHLGRCWVAFFTTWSGTSAKAAAVCMATSSCGSIQMTSSASARRSPPPSPSAAKFHRATPSILTLTRAQMPLKNACATWCSGSKCTAAARSRLAVAAISETPVSTVSRSRPTPRAPAWTPSMGRGSSTTARTSTMPTWCLTTHWCSSCGMPT
jgi:hypothetical protein